MIINECNKLVLMKNTTWLNWAWKVIHRELCKRFKFDHTTKYYINIIESVLENKILKISWDFERLTNHLILARKPNIVLINNNCFIAVWYNYTYTYICGNIINNNDERTHFFRKIYLSHFIRKGCERVVCERWVGNRTDCNILTSSPSDYSSTSSSLCWAAQPGVLRDQALCWELVLTASNCKSNPNCNWLQLTRTVCGTGLYNCLTSTCFPWASQSHRIQPIHRSRL